MNKLLPLAFALLLTTAPAWAQGQGEPEIRRLEQLEITTVQRGDTAALLRLWSPEFVVNNPYNQVVTRPQILAFMRQGQLDYATVERVVEKVTIVKNVAIAMGHEIVTPQRATAYAGQVETRQYTNVWLKTKAGWQLTARQASIVAVKK
ncbi:nuclear transport factor 2 family protein [Hymenobacter volaticus]|uniref:Nuclear transport factor 2 family protein n=1 Tax=Hymenobacter volaticus TaxID=2932254 RepID=A0ABY4GED0_9BACT|nr:nuclear transport factor 2 family protein [Hymenobacter volaticus]UOQ69203.1 nuclear transport factor 2 family protein [Hymenobacter volaticus]